MKVKNVIAISSILLFAQLRRSGEGTQQSWYRTAPGLLKINIVVFSLAFILPYVLLLKASMDIITWLTPLAVQILSMIPLVTLSFMVIYGILFVIGETSQYASSEMVNYMPISSTEYVLGSSISTVIMYLFILTGLLGLSLAFALALGVFGVWAMAALLGTFFMLVGGFVAEIIRALVNRVSSSFSKRGGRSAIISRAIGIILVLALVQLLFNPNFLYRILQGLAPQLQGLWFIPLFWPSLASFYLIMGDLATSAIYVALTIAFGGVLMAIAVVLRSRYWVPLPVTIKLGSSQAGTYKGTGFLGRFGFSQAETALVRKDTRSLFRRKEMVRFLALPIIILVPFFLTLGSGDYQSDFYSLVLITLMGAGMFGFFLSITALGQEGSAVWNIFASPLRPRSLFRAKITSPLLISLIPAFALPLVASLLLGFSPLRLTALVIIALLITVISVMIGGYLGSKYADFEEKPRNSYVRATGILVGFIILTLVGGLCISPLIFYVFSTDYAMSIGFNAILALLATIGLSAVIIALLYRMASSSFVKALSDPSSL